MYVEITLYAGSFQSIILITNVKKTTSSFQNPIYSPVFQTGVLLIFCSMNFPLIFFNGHQRIDK